MGRTWGAYAALTAVFAAGSLRAGQDESPDAWITMKTRLKLLTSERLGGNRLRVATCNGVVILHGRVASDAEREEAARLAGEVKGARHVTNFLEVAPQADGDATTAGDAELRSAVGERLAGDPRFDGISVAAVDDGVVRLQGEADSLAEALAAVEAAASVSGVRRVASGIAVPGHAGPR